MDIILYKNTYVSTKDLLVHPYYEPLPEYDISGMGVMVLCKACPKYMELLNKNNKGSVIQDETSLKQVDSDDEKSPKKTAEKNRQKKSAEKIGRKE